jgi:lipopolysaccharide transport system ATP-binding protein
MGTITVAQLGKAYKQYHNRWSRLAEWLIPGHKPQHSLKWVLQDISFTVAPGEAVGIIGINGAGKSTLLKMITGTTVPSTGNVHVSGRVAAMLELGMGFHPDFTGRQNAYMAGQLLGYSVDEITRLLPEIEAFAEIGDYFDQPVRIYSSGMSVRLAFAVATANRPDVLIVDEALSVGDAYFQHKSFRRIRQFQEQGTTLLLVSHDVAAVRGICDRAIWLDKGVIRLQGDPKDVADAYAASLYEEHQNIAEAAAPVKIERRTRKNPPNWKRDVRQDFINASNLRNDIQVFDFQENGERWGDGAAKIIAVRLTDVDGTPLSWMVGGEEVLLTIETHALRDLNSVIIGFLVRDRLGQPLFGDNTFLTTIDTPVSAKAEQTVVAHFAFLLPILPQGSYAVTAAVAVGTQDNHVINDWMNQAVMFDSHNRSAVSGMVGIPMHKVVLDVNE